MGGCRKESLLQAEGASYKNYDVDGAQTVRGRNVFVCFGGERGLLFTVVRGLLLVVVSLFVEHGL